MTENLGMGGTGGASGGVDGGVDGGVNEVEAICRRLIFDSAAHNDAGDWDALGRLYAVDGELTRPSGQTIVGRDAIVEAYRGGPVDRLTRHVCSNVRIDLTGPTTATGHTVVLLFAADRSSDSKPDGPAPVHNGAAVGEFADEFRLTADGWRLSRRVASIVLRPAT